MSTVEATTTTPAPPRRSFRSLMTEPVVGPLLRSRFCAVGSSVLGIWQVWSALASVTVWECPMLRYTHLPCPGCGLSRASAELFRGHFWEMLHFHAFAPFFMIALAAFVVASVLPGARRDRFADWVTRLERRLPLAPSLLLFLMLYWLARLSLHVIHSR